MNYVKRYPFRIRLSLNRDGDLRDNCLQIPLKPRRLLSAKNYSFLFLVEMPYRAFFT